MIVDLMRNDLGRVSAYGTVTAPRYPTAEGHPGVWHLVSRVRGRLRPGVGNSDVLRATFPPGSVTGAPKVQALRVIAESELTGREVYTGAIGYASPVAGLELSVAIRTLELRDGQLWLGVGGGIVADSDPAAELEEALVKARPIAAAVGSSVVVGAAGGLTCPTRRRAYSKRCSSATAASRRCSAHLDRLAASVSQLYGLTLPDRLADTVRRQASELSGAHRLRVDATPSEGRLSVSVTTTVLGARPRAFTCVPVTIAGGHGPHKWRDRTALTGGADVPLLVDEDGSVLEAAWANVWLLEGRRLSTPPADGRLLAGVTRARLFELAPSLGLEAAERRISLAEARAARGACCSPRRCRWWPRSRSTPRPETVRSWRRSGPRWRAMTGTNPGPC